MRIYISGKITGTTNYMERFAEVEERLTNQGHEVINPAKICATLPITLGYEDYMTLSRAELSICDVIYMMHGWEHSEGAGIENVWAMEMDKEILYEVR